MAVDAFRTLVAAGTIKEDVKVWAEGMDHWVPFDECGDHFTGEKEVQQLFESSEIYYEGAPDEAAETPTDVDGIIAMLGSGIISLDTKVSRHNRTPQLYTPQPRARSPPLPELDTEFGGVCRCGVRAWMNGNRWTSASTMLKQQSRAISALSAG
jgi:hypothetical protein